MSDERAHDYTPGVHVEDTDEAYRAALAAGAKSAGEPHDVMPGVRNRAGSRARRRTFRTVRADRLTVESMRERHADALIQSQTTSGHR